MHYLDVFLKGQSWAAGPSMTIADFSIVTTVATAEVRFINLLVYGRKSNGAARPAGNKWQKRHYHAKLAPGVY